MVGPASKIDWADDAAAEDSQNQRVEGDFDEKGKKAGPDSSTTSLGSESMRIKLSVDKKEAEQEESAKIKMELGGKKVSCRLCQGDHFTARCPHKDTLGDIDDAAPPEIGEGAPGDGATGPGGKYVPPSMRA